MNRLQILFASRAAARRRTSLASISLLLLGLVLSGCRSGTAPEVAGDAAGTYTLASVDGKPLPARVAHEGASLEVRSGTFTLEADGTGGTRTVFLPPSGRETVREAHATWTREGSRFTLKWKGAGITHATLAGQTLTMENEGMVFLYRK